MSEIRENQLNTDEVDTYDEEAQQEKSFFQQAYEFLTEGTPIDLGGGGVDSFTGESTNKNNQTTTSDSQTTSSDSSVTVQEATQLIEQVTEAEDPLQAFAEWMTSTFEDSQIRLSPKTVSQIQYMSQMMLGKAQYSPLTVEQIQQEYGDTFAYNADYGVYVYQPSGGGEPTILMDDGTGKMVYATLDEATGTYTPSDQSYNVLSGYDGTGILSKEWAKASGVMDGILDHLFGKTGESGEREGGVFAKLSSAADGGIKVKTGQNIYDESGQLREGYALVPGTAAVDPVTPANVEQLQSLFPDAQYNEGGGWNDSGNQYTFDQRIENLDERITGNIDDLYGVSNKTSAKNEEAPSLSSLGISLVKEKIGDWEGYVAKDSNGDYIGYVNYFGSLVNFRATRENFGLQEYSKYDPKYEDYSSLPISTQYRLSTKSDGGPVRSWGTLLTVNSPSVTVGDVTYYQQADGTFADDGGNVLQTDGTPGTRDTYTYNGEPIQVDADGNVIEDSTVYDRVESVIADLLGDNGAIALAEQDIQDVRDMGAAIADIGDRFGAYTTDEDGNTVYNPNSFEGRYAAYEDQFTGEGGIASQYQDVLNKLQPYEELSLGLADDYAEVGAQYRKMFNESRGTSPYTQWQDLLYAGAAENVNQGAEGARETLNTQYAQAGVNPNSPAYTAALMELEKNRAASLQQARRQAAVDSFNMGAQAMSNSASLLGGVERSLAGKGTAYGMGINTLLSEGNLISNKANALMQGVGLLGQQAGSALQQADLYNTSAGISANAANLQLGAAGQALNFANAGVGNVGNYLQNQLAANNPYITMAPLVTNYGQSILNSINTLQSGAAQTSGDIDVSNATNNVLTSD